VISEPDAETGAVTVHDGLDGPTVAVCNNMEEALAYSRGLQDGFTYARRLIGSASVRPIQIARFSARTIANAEAAREAKRKAREGNPPPAA
jgi:hypothetical protein